MGITMIVTGRLGKPERPSFLSRRAHLLTTRIAGGGMACSQRALSEGDAAPSGAYSQCCQDCDPGHHCLRGGDRRADPSACENLHPAALSQRQGES